MRYECEVWPDAHMGYLGHFAQPRFLHAGHNDSGENDDAQIDKYYASSYGGLAPNRIGLPNAETQS